ncbi:MAG: hypothetical protein HQM10_03195 [Candidatus Riflebacteria bacterium]|nr:hypothetical protein [Candidatus Riflebacteria bacterium]
MKRTFFGRKTGVTLLELIVASFILAFIFQIGIRVWHHFIGKTSDTLTKRLYLQMEARKSTINLFKELQEGIEIVSPSPGSTFHYLVYLNYVNQVKLISLEKDQTKSNQEKKEIYKAIVSTKNSDDPADSAKKVIMENVLELNFTPYSNGGVLVNTTLAGGGGVYSFVNFVRLQNVTADDQD